MFNKTACDAHLKLDYSPGLTYLVAICNNEEGTGVEDDILLDKHLGNKDGQWLYRYPAADCSNYGAHYIRYQDTLTGIAQASAPAHETSASP